MKKNNLMLVKHKDVLLDFDADVWIRSVSLNGFLDNAVSTMFLSYNGFRKSAYVPDTRCEVVMTFEI